MKQIIVKVTAVVLILVLCIVCAAPLASRLSDENAFPETVEVLEKQEGRLTKMTAGAALAATALAAVPSDITTPVADELADMISVFAASLAAVFLEKFLLTKLCLVAFRFIIPAGLALLALFAVFRRELFFHIGVKVVLFGLVIAMVIPVGAKVSMEVEEMYEDKIQAAEDIGTQVQEAESAKEISEEEIQAVLEGSEEGNRNWQDVVSFFTGIPQTVSEKLHDLPDSMTQGIQELKETAQNWIQTFVMGLAVILISTIVIPIGILLLGLWLVRTIAEIPVSVPSLPAAMSRKELQTKNTDETD